jgi:hypothetical protein
MSRLPVLLMLFGLVVACAGPAKAPPSVLEFQLAAPQGRRPPPQHYDESVPMTELQRFPGAVPAV